jgi:4-hydroxybenzoate polyprenyltransferase
VINVFHLQNFPFTEGVIDEGLVVIIELLLISLLALIWLWCYDSAKCKAILKNMRLTRSLHYMLLCLLGVFAYHLEALPIKDLFTFIRITGMLLAVFFAFQFSVVINDIFDIGCDKVSNIGRPLITQAINKDDYLNIGCVYLALGLLFSFWVSRTCTMITLLFIAFYFLYSAPPLRLKRFFPLSSFIIGIQATLAFAVGKLSFEENNAVAYYRNYLFWLVFIVFSLSSSVKDLKDIEGDKQTGVVTLPVLLGEENGRKLIAVLVFLSYCFVPYFLILAFHKTYAIVLSLGFGLINLFYIRKKSAKEKIIFFIYFIYAFLLILIVR